MGAHPRSSRPLRVKITSPINFAKAMKHKSTKAQKHKSTKAQKHKPQTTNAQTTNHKPQNRAARQCELQSQLLWCAERMHVFWVLESCEDHLVQILLLWPKICAWFAPLQSPAVATMAQTPTPAPSPVMNQDSELYEVSDTPHRYAEHTHTHAPQEKSACAQIRNHTHSLRFCLLSFLPCSHNSWILNGQCYRGWRFL